ncbi:hypothetical protein AB0F88_21685 [Streptosporangium sp. NPDC023963]|uniref:hypothetical protein n=1 Tax=Streptosporangium sp. NPDC023963 TaxID=3155608 RepID=UPI003417A71E
MLGFSACTITDATAAVYAEQIGALDAEHLPYLNSPNPDSPFRSRRTPSLCRHRRPIRGQPVPDGAVRGS